MRICYIPGIAKTIDYTRIYYTPRMWLTNLPLPAAALWGSHRTCHSEAIAQNRDAITMCFSAIDQEPRLPLVSVDSTCLRLTTKFALASCDDFIKQEYVKWSVYNSLNPWMELCIAFSRLWSSWLCVTQAGELILRIFPLSKDFYVASPAWKSELITVLGNDRRHFQRRYCLRPQTIQKVD